MERALSQRMSFIGNVQINSRIQVDEATNNADSDRPIIVHRELLENASAFFRKALDNEMWKETMEQRIQLNASRAVLGVFASWLYRRNLGQLSWRHCIDAYIFGLDYLIDALPPEILHYMLANGIDEDWDPNLQDIEHVYEHTSDACPLRELLIISFAKSCHDKQAIIFNAPESFVRSYALHASASSNNSIYDFRSRQMRTTRSCSQTAALDFNTVLIFPLEDSDRAAVLHASVLSAEPISLGKEEPVLQVVGTRLIDLVSFKSFASWLYFDDDLCADTHGCQQSPDLNYISGLYKAGMMLSLCEVQELTVGAGSRHSSESLSASLRSQGHRFRKALLKAAAAYCQRRPDPPSLGEIARVYSITTGGDPLRELIVRVCICKRSSDSVNNLAVPSEFRDELTSALLLHVADMQGYIDKVQELSKMNFMAAVRQLTKRELVESAERGIQMNNVTRIPLPRALYIEERAYST